MDFVLSCFQHIKHILFIKINQTLGNSKLGAYYLSSMCCVNGGGGSFYYKASLIGSDCKCVFVVSSSLHIWFCFSFLVLVPIHSSYFLSPPQFCHIYAFGLEALFALVLTQDKNCAACSLPFVFAFYSCCQSHFCSSPLFVCAHICLNICRVKACLLSLVRLFFFLPLIGNKDFFST